MFTKDELEIIFKVFETLECKNDEEELLKKKMNLLNKQRQIGDAANEQITKLQNEISKLYEKGGEEDGRE